MHRTLSPVLFIRRPDGAWAIGYGTTSYRNGTLVREGQRITEPQARAMLRQKIDRFARHVDAVIGPRVTLRQQQFDALVSLAASTTLATFKSSSLMRRVRADPDDPDIRFDFVSWIHDDRGQHDLGLIQRRRKEADLYFS